MILIHKGSRNKSEMENYISWEHLSSLSCKLFDHFIIHGQLRELKTDDLQYAYNANTVQCASIIQETIIIIISNGSHVVYVGCISSF